MLIPVIYFDNHPGKVSPEELDDLIRRRLIIAFRRSSGWVKVADCQHRGSGGTYNGPNRRKDQDY